MSLLWLAVGLGCLWHGGQILWVSALPTQLRRNPPPKPEPGTPQAFGRFWINQYAWIGLALCVIGGTCVLLALTR